MPIRFPLRLFLQARDDPHAAAGAGRPQRGRDRPHADIGSGFAPRQRDVRYAPARMRVIAHAMRTGPGRSGQ